jgi:manganese transport protein
MFPRNTRAHTGTVAEACLSSPICRFDGGPATPARMSDAPNLARRILSFAGPGYLVAVGYMDPGNWATALAGGSQFGYTLLCVVVISSVVAMFFQAAAIRLGLAGGGDLAQSCRDSFPRSVNLALWIFCEVAIVACNVAEVLGMAIGLNLLFGIPLLLGVALTITDVMLVLGLQRWGFGIVQGFVAALVFTIAVCFAMQLVWVGPQASAVLSGLLPRAAILRNPDMLYVAVGIIGATVMPHNLYLHSSLVRTSRPGTPRAAVPVAIRWATVDSTLALTVAMLVNAAILVVAAAAFHRPDQPPVADLSEAYRLLSPVLGVGLASVTFGLALVASGLSSSVTGTMAGQIVMEGFLGLRASTGWRAFTYRLMAAGPAAVAVALLGPEGAGRLLVLSQVVLSIQLPFAVVPLLLFTTRKRHLGEAAFGWPMSIALWLFALLIIGLNCWMLSRQWLDR